jgi:tetratricopeptide (TPR) repeat protein
MSTSDCRNQAMSTNSSKAASAYDRALELTASYFLDPLAVIDEALREEPDFVMGHCLKAGLAVMSTERGALPILSEAVEAVARLSSRANERELAHARAARAWLAGEFSRSVELYGEILLEHPRDLLALQVAHIGDFLLGSSQMLRERPAQVMEHWDASVPGYGYVLGMYAFGLEETALYSRAEDMGHRALAQNPRDPWAVHAVTHVLEMQGRIQEGIDFLTTRAPDWAPHNGLSFHNHWHLALFHLELGEADRALAIYDAHIRPKPTRVAYENVDAAALLWRLHLRGVPTGDRFQPLADDWDASEERGHYAFNDVHAMIAFTGAGRTELGLRAIAELERRTQGIGTNAMMARDVGLPLSRAIHAFGLGRYTECVELLLPIRTQVSRFGGSHAQRDLVHLTLVEAALRAGNVGLSRALCAERTELKPSSPFNFLLAARAQRLAGDDLAASRAQRSAELGEKAQRSRASGLRGRRAGVLLG